MNRSESSSFGSGGLTWFVAGKSLTRLQLGQCEDERFAVGAQQDSSAAVRVVRQGSRRRHRRRRRLPAVNVIVGARLSAESGAIEVGNGRLLLLVVVVVCRMLRLQQLLRVTRLSK